MIAVTGTIGYWFFRKGSTIFGLGAIALYAVFGFAGLDHYALAPISAHTATMNATIVGEAITAAALLVVVAWMTLGEIHRPLT